MTLQEFEFIVAELVIRRKSDNPNIGFRTNSGRSFDPAPWARGMNAPDILVRHVSEHFCFVPIGEIEMVWG